VSKEPFQKIINYGNLFLIKRSSLIIIFIIALLIGIGISHPQFLLNDEWITANQLTQIDQGHQFVLNEGKYGFYSNGTPNAYFKSHNNALGYPLFLPLISLPAQKFINLLGDTSDYWIFTIWSLLLILLGLIIQKMHPKWEIFHRIQFSTLLIIIAFIIFILNMILYIAFFISPVGAPKEAASIILTNNLLFAGSVTLIFSTISSMFRDRGYILFGTFVCVTSSSFLIWASSAKDHMLEIFLFSLVIFTLVKYFYTKKIGYVFFSFLIIGILSWDRPEIGIFLFFALFAALTPYFIREWMMTNMKEKIGYLFFFPIFTALGAIPLFINNYLLTGNPFTLIYSVWNTSSGGTVSDTVTTISTNCQVDPRNLVSFTHLVFSWITPQFDTFGHDISRILFLPETGSIGLFVLVPVFLIGLLSIPFLMKYRPGQFSTDECFLMISLLLMALAIIIAYTNSFPVLITDKGIAPDIRYFSPVYLSLNLVGLLILSKFIEIIHSTHAFFKYTGVTICLLVPVFLGIISIYKHQNEDFFSILSQVSLWISFMIMMGVIVTIIILYFCMKKQSYKKPFIAVLGLLVALPLVWQIMTIFLIANLVKLFAGYNFWLPFIRDGSYFLYSFL